MTTALLTLQLGWLCLSLPLIFALSPSSRLSSVSLAPPAPILRRTSLATWPSALWIRTDQLLLQYLGICIQKDPLYNIDTGYCNCNTLIPVCRTFLWAKGLKDSLIRTSLINTVELQLPKVSPTQLLNLHFTALENWSFHLYLHLSCWPKGLLSKKQNFPCSQFSV